MVAAIEAAPASASALGPVGATLDAAVQFAEVRECGDPRRRIITSSHELQERELIKAASLAATTARALRAQGYGDTAALAALTSTTIMHIAAPPRLASLPTRTRPDR